MTAFGVGRGTTAEFRGSADPGAFVARVTHYIPGDVLVLYAASITWVGQAPSLPLLLGFTVATPLIAMLGAWSRGTERPVERSDWVSAALTLPAFAIWSSSLPDSGWRAWAWFSSNPGWVTTIGAVAGVLFSAFAMGIDRRLKDDETLAVKRKN